MGRSAEDRALIGCARGPQRSSKRTCFKDGIITATIRSRGGNPDRRIAIQGAKSKHLYNAYPRGASEPLIKIGRPRLKQNGLNGPFHRNRRSKRSDGYAQMYYKTKCSSTI